MKLESWQWTSILLCGFGLFKEFRPSEPFFTPYLLDYKDVTQDELVHTAFPSYTYTYLATLAVVFLVTDYLRYRSVVIFEGFAYVLCWIILTWGNGLLSVMFVEFLYGTACSTEVAYYTYIYAKVDREHYQKVTSYTYSAILAGRFLGGLTGQLLITFDLMNYHQLNYISLGCVSTALIFSLFLPSVKQSIYFHRRVSYIKTPDQEIVHQETKVSLRQKLQNTKRYMLEDLKSAYGNTYVLKWSIWWAVATAGHLQIINFIQALWEVIVTENGSGTQDYNGAVEAAHTLISSILAFGVGHVKISWKKWGEALLSVSACVQCGALIWISRTESLYIAYGCYMIFRILFQVIITVASAEVAQRISDDSFGLIFGINTFIALSLQTIVTLVVADEVGLSMNERDQFLTYGICFGILGAAFIIALIFTLISPTTREINSDAVTVAVPLPNVKGNDMADESPTIVEGRT
ncbi:unnamed protein product [Orchesella dallaii]|uniref:Thiamine transporter 2 n=1 Tax=Orchesella dallaii TaxID=48710 RepID=A0ABP1RAH9_9HEXA